MVSATNANEKRKFFIYKLDTTKKHFVDELPHRAVELAAVQIFTTMRNSKVDSPRFIGSVDPYVAFTDMNWVDLLLSPSTNHTKFSKVMSNFNMSLLSQIKLSNRQGALRPSEQHNIENKSAEEIFRLLTTPVNDADDEHIDLEQSALDAFKALSLANARNEKLKEKLKIRNELERRL